tara:strand:+ start:399 stop:602 length:204 start_codon:yes stop_codon:yes gene_type:complete
VSGKQRKIILIFGVIMKRKPDAMFALIALFFVGLVVSGFSSLTVGSNRATFEHAATHYQAEEKSLNR